MEKRELKWFEDRIGQPVMVKGRGANGYDDQRVIKDREHAQDCYNSQENYEFVDARDAVAPERQQAFMTEDESYKPLKFGEALEALRQGKKISRLKWYGEANMEAKAFRRRFVPGYWQLLSILGSPMIIAKLRGMRGGYAPAQPYQSDLLAEDWFIMEEKIEEEDSKKE